MTQIVPPPEYEDHEGDVPEWEEYTSVWEKLSDFWDLMTNKGLVTVFWKAWDAVRMEMEKYFDFHKYDFSFKSDSYKSKISPEIREFVIGDDNRVEGTLHSYYVDEDIRDIVSASNFIQQPSLTYVNREAVPSATHSFSFTDSPLRGTTGVITFHDNAYKSTSRLWGDGNYRLWLTYIPKRHEEIVNKFGPFVAYTSTERLEIETLNALNALFFVHEFGPSIPNIETALYVYLDWPYAIQSGTVTDIDGDVLTITSANGVEKTVTSPIVTRPFQRRDDDGNWVDIVLGDELAIYEPVTKMCVIEDIFTDPWFWVRVGISGDERYHHFSIQLNGDTSDTTGSYYDLQEILRILDRIKPIGDKPWLMESLFISPGVPIDACNYAIPPPSFADNACCDGMGVETLLSIIDVSASTFGVAYMTNIITVLGTLGMTVPEADNLSCLSSWDDVPTVWTGVTVYSDWEG